MSLKYKIIKEECILGTEVAFSFYTGFLSCPPEIYCPQEKSGRYLQFNTGYVTVIALVLPNLLKSIFKLCLVRHDINNPGPP